MKRTISWVGIIALIIVIVAFLWTRRTHDAVVDSTVSDTVQPSSPDNDAQPIPSMIEVSSPLANAQITSPLTIIGRARGGWYFEASFPIELRNQNNVLIGNAIAQAQSDWMTANFVPFMTVLAFPHQPAGSTGTLVFKKDNPSGEPQNDDSITVPVQF